MTNSIYILVICVLVCVISHIIPDHLIARKWVTYVIYFDTFTWIMVFVVLVNRQRLLGRGGLVSPYATVLVGVMTNWADSMGSWGPV